MSEIVVRTRVLELKEKSGLVFAGADDATVDTVTSALVAAYKEYQFTARPTLKLVVEKVVKKLMDEAAAPKAAPSVVSSLNQMIYNGHGKSASKRTRPEDFDAPVVAEEESNKDDTKDGKISGDEKFTGEPGAVPIKSAAEKTSASSKKKKVVSSRSSEVSDSINPLLVSLFANHYCNVVASLSAVCDCVYGRRISTS